MSCLSEGRFPSTSVPLITRNAQRTMLRTDDGIAVDAVYEPCTGSSARGPGAVQSGTAIVVAHGFTGSADRPAVRRAARVFARHAAVITFSFRGHGGSAGRSTVGDREVLDLAAAVSWARALGHRRVVTVGFSMGGSVVLRHAALYPDPVAGGGAAARAPGSTGARERRLGECAGAHSDAVVSVSAPARWYYRGTAPMRRLHWVVTRPAGRFVGQYGFRTRIDRHDWNPVPLSPVEAVPQIAVPLLIVHGTRDPYFPLDHPKMLAQASRGAAELWLEPGMGHAENAADESLLTRIADWTAPV